MAAASFNSMRSRANSSSFIYWSVNAFFLKIILLGIIFSPTTVVAKVWGFHRFALDDSATHGASTPSIISLYYTAEFFSRQEEMLDNAKVLEVLDQHFLHAELELGIALIDELSELNIVSTEFSTPLIDGDNTLNIKGWCDEKEENTLFPDSNCHRVLGRIEIKLMSMLGEDELLEESMEIGLNQYFELVSSSMNDIYSFVMKGLTTETIDSRSQNISDGLNNPNKNDDQEQTPPEQMYKLFGMDFKYWLPISIFSGSLLVVALFVVWTTKRRPNQKEKMMMKDDEPELLKMAFTEDHVQLRKCGEECCESEKTMQAIDNLCFRGYHIPSTICCSSATTTTNGMTLETLESSEGCRTCECQKQKK